jgi:hypothetical protein
LKNIGLLKNNGDNFSIKMYGKRRFYPHKIIDIKNIKNPYAISILKNS